MIAKIKEISEQVTPVIAVSSSVLSVTHELATQLSLSSKSSLLQMSRRKRRINDLVDHPNPTNRRFEVPEIFEDFLLADTGRDDSGRILIFGDKELIELLQFSKQWLAEGTFKLSPSVFYQIYTIHPQVGHLAPACLYALLRNKTEKT